MKQAHPQEELIWRLELIARLLLAQTKGKEAPSMADMISYLDKMGLPPGQIAPIVGKPLNYVTATLSNRRKGKARQ